MERRSFILAALLGGALLAGAPSLAFAQPQARSTPPQDLRDMLRPRDVGAQAPVAARYVAENRAFIFDRSTPSIRFDGAREIIVLVRQPAPQGGAVYLNDLGEPVLKVSGLGGMTLFTPERPQGVPVAFIAIASPLQLETIRAVDLFGRMGSTSNQISRTIGRVVGFEAPDIGPESAALVVDVLNLTLLAYQKNASNQRARQRSQRVGVIEILEGSNANVMVQGERMRIIIDPSKGVAGRPSSERISRALAR